MKKVSLMLVSLLFVSGIVANDSKKDTGLVSKESARQASIAACIVASCYVFSKVNKALYIPVKDEDSKPVALFKHGANAGRYVVSGVVGATVGSLVALAVVGGLRPQLLDEEEKEPSNNGDNSRNDR